MLCALFRHRIYLTNIRYFCYCNLHWKLLISSPPVQCNSPVDVCGLFRLQLFTVKTVLALEMFFVVVSIGICSVTDMFWLCAKISLCRWLWNNFCLQQINNKNSDMEHISTTLQTRGHLVMFAHNIIRIIKSLFGVTFQLYFSFFLSLAATGSGHS